MTTLIIFHEVNDGNIWANAWKKGPGSRHELFAKYGITAQTFRDPANLNSTGVLLHVPDMKTFQEAIDSQEGKKAMAEDGLKLETMRALAEFTP